MDELGSYALLGILLDEDGHHTEANRIMSQAETKFQGSCSLDGSSESLVEWMHLDMTELELWVREEWDDRIPISLAALLFDAPRLAERETFLKLAIEYGDESYVSMLIELCERTGRERDAASMRAVVNGGRE